MELGLRAGGLEDAAQCGAVSYEALRAIAEAHGFMPDMASLEVATENFVRWLSKPGLHVLVAESEGRIVGSSVMDERASIVGLGPITVDPEAQDRGIGRLLTEGAIQRAAARGAAGLRLIQSAYHARSLALYTKLGFQVREPLVNMQGPPIALPVPGREVRTATENDVRDCDAVCLRVHGHDRGPELRDAIERGTVRLVEHQGRVTGYATALGFFGHAVGDSNSDLMALIGAADSFAGPGFLLPSRNTELLRWCLDHGLRAVQPMTLMSMGSYREPAGACLSSIVY